MRKSIFHDQTTKQLSVKISELVQDKLIVFVGGESLKILKKSQNPQKIFKFSDFEKVFCQKIKQSISSNFQLGDFEFDDRMSNCGYVSCQVQGFTDDTLRIQGRRPKRPDKECLSGNS